MLYEYITLTFIFNFVYVYMYLYVGGGGMGTCVKLPLDARREHQISKCDIDFQVVVRWPIKVLGMELRSSVNAGSALNHSAIPLAPATLIFKQNWH